MQRSTTLADSGQKNIISNAFDHATKELTQIKHYYGKRSQKRACAVGAMVYFYGRIDPDRPNSLRVDLLPPHVKIVWKAFVEYLHKKYRSDVVELNDDSHWTFERFKQEAAKWEHMTFADGFT